MEVTNRFFNLIHPLLPMTYGINGLRQAITGGFGTTYLQSNLWILVGYAVIFYLLILLVADRGQLRFKLHQMPATDAQKTKFGTQRDSKLV